MCARTADEGVCAPPHPGCARRQETFFSPQCAQKGPLGRTSFARRRRRPAISARASAVVDGGPARPAPAPLGPPQGRRVPAFPSPPPCIRHRRAQSYPWPPTSARIRRRRRSGLAAIPPRVAYHKAAQAATGWRASCSNEVGGCSLATPSHCHSHLEGLRAVGR